VRFPAIRALLVLCLSGAFLGLATPAALAHDSLKSSSPAKDSTVSRLDQIELEFSAHVSFPVVILHDAGGRRYESGTARTDGPKVFENVTSPLPSGSYVIAWRIVSSDGHPVEGEIPFTLRAAAGSTGTTGSSGTATAPAASGAAAPGLSPGSAPAEASQLRIPGWIWAALGLLVVIGAAVLLMGNKAAPRTDEEAPAERPDDVTPEQGRPDM
jgi:methionine-rich copper-binding protein CopC